MSKLPIGSPRLERFRTGRLLTGRYGMGAVA